VPVVERIAMSVVDSLKKPLNHRPDLVLRLGEKREKNPLEVRQTSKKMVKENINVLG
jgi:hypothetical protein